MKTRERRLALVAGFCFLVLFGYLGVGKLIIQPSRSLDIQIRELQKRSDDLAAENRKAIEHRARIREIALLTYDHDELQASEKSRARLVEMLRHAGLSLDRLSLRPVRGARVPNSYQELGWLLRIRGTTSQIVGFLFLLSQDAYLHRLDNLTLSPVADTDDVELNMKYTTIIMEYARGEKPVARPADQPPPRIAALTDPKLAHYSPIARRSLFRAYVPRVVPEQVATTEQPPPPVHVDPNPDARLRVVALSDWDGKPEVLVRDTLTGQTTRYGLGDTVVNATIVGIDYRPLPRPGNPALMSGSRVILEQDRGQYMAIDLGQSLAERRRLDPAMLPPSLARSGESSAGSAAPTDATP